MPYDIHSLMHYDNKAFTKNQHDTMQARDNPREDLGGRSLSSTDLKQIWLLYKCKRPRYKVRKGKARHTVYFAWTLKGHRLLNCIGTAFMLQHRCHIILQKTIMLWMTAIGCVSTKSEEQSEAIRYYPRSDVVASDCCRSNEIFLLLSMHNLHNNKHDRVAACHVSGLFSLFSFNAAIV